MKDQLRFRVMTGDDLQQVLHWAAQEGWNPGLDDAAAFLAADPQGFFLAEVAGTPVAAISVVNHGPRFAFLGLYLCRPDWRGRGIGLALWRHALDHAGSRIVGLDGVPAQQDNYRASGFALAGQTTRYQISAPMAGSAWPKSPKSPKSPKWPETAGDLRLATEADIPALVAQESAASGWDKSAFLHGWFRNTATRVTWVCPGDGGLDGLVTVRRCLSGAKIGPLVARDADVARRLLAGAMQWADTTVMIYVPAGATGLTALCQDWGMTPGFQTARMYRGAQQPPETAEFYATATLELG